MLEESFFVYKSCFSKLFGQVAKWSVWYVIEDCCVLFHWNEVELNVDMGSIDCTFAFI